MILTKPKYIGNMQQLSNLPNARYKPAKRKVTAKMRKYFHIEKQEFHETEKLPSIETLIQKYDISEQQARLIKSMLVRHKSELLAAIAAVDINEKVIKNKLTSESIISTSHVKDKLIDIRNRLLIEKTNKVSEIRTQIVDGFIYLVTNKSWHGWIKAGMTVDYEDRLSTYNVYDPTNGFILKEVKWVKNRKQSEQQLIIELANNATLTKGEWFNIPENVAKTIFDNI